MKRGIQVCSAAVREPDSRRCPQVTDGSMTHLFLYDPYLQCRAERRITKSTDKNLQDVAGAPE